MAPRTSEVLQTSEASQIQGIHAEKTVSYNAEVHRQEAHVPYCSPEKLNTTAQSFDYTIT